jgi:hypothetical protein
MQQISKERPIVVDTVCGALNIKRDYEYCRHCCITDTPLDHRLRIDQLKHGMTNRLRVETAFYGQNQASFEEAAERIEKHYGVAVSDETVRVVTEEIGQLVFEADAEKARTLLAHMQEIEMLDEGEKRNDTLFIEIDGAAVNTRVRNEDGSTWRENKTVIAFTGSDLVERKGSAQIKRKRYAALIGSAEAFRGFVLDAALEAGYGQIKDVVILSDGAAWIRHMCEELFPEAVQILDLFHLKENVYAYAKERFGNEAKQYIPWAEKVNALLEAGDAEGAILEIGGTPGKEINLRTYIENNRHKIEYPTYRAKGWFVGSGAIESANKVIVQRRLKQAGMRWSVSGAQYVLTLRCKCERKVWQTEVAAKLCA